MSWSFLLAAAFGEPLKIESPQFQPNAPIPRVHTCQGEDKSPALVFSDVPGAAKSLVLIVDDPDAPDPQKPKMTWVHWVLYNIPVTAVGLPEGVAVGELPAGTRQGKNDWKRTGYGGPCPPVGTHRYFHKLYALDVELPDLHEPTKDQLLAAIQGHVIAQAELVGTYRKESAPRP